MRSARNRPRPQQHHSPALRLMHWLNALAILIMIGSGLRIYNWYPALPWHFWFPGWISLGGDVSVAETLHNEDGLTNALAWHFAGLWLLILNFLAYLTHGVVTGHFRRDFLPLRPRAVLHDLADALHGRLDHQLGHYNAVQKTFYWGVILAILVTILSGLSIWKPVQLHVLAALFGGYEMARIVHFFGMSAIVAFLIVHVALTILVPKTFVSMTIGKAVENDR